jgi:WD40 repeat protein
MRGTIATNLDDSAAAAGATPDKRSRSGRVRLSWISREGLVVLLGLVVAAAIFSVLDDGGPEDRRGAPVALSHDDLLESLIVAFDQRTLISCGRDDTVRIWALGDDPSTPGREIDRLPHGSHPFALAPSPDGRFLAVGGENDMAVWERGEEGWKRVASMESLDCRGLAFAPDSRTLAIGTAEGTVRLVEAPSMRERATLGGFSDRVHSVEFSPDGATLAAVAFNRELKLWDWKSGVERKRLAQAIGPIHCFAFTPDGRSLAVSPWGFQSGGPTLWDLETGALRRRFPGQPDGVNRLVVSPDGRFLATATVNQTVKAWEIKTGAVAAVLDGDLGWVKTLAFTQDGARIAYGGRDGAIRFWDFAAARAARRPDSVPELAVAACESIEVARAAAPEPGPPQGASGRKPGRASGLLFFFDDSEARSAGIGD